ncbi:MAG: hypothetical protein EHM70_24480 [Chloroflexota bacterium]|nr:MAG: hypothetical protein EHM70_24480 [Chloroflexota bacterium]
MSDQTEYQKDQMSKCRMCGKEIIFVGPYWDHIFLDTPKPRHPALPVEESTDVPSPEPRVEHHRALVRISHEFLRDLLFPEGSEVLAVMTDAQDIFGRGDFVCVVEHPNLPVSHPGMLLLTATPTYRALYEPENNQVRVVEFVDWGLGK